MSSYIPPEVSSWLRSVIGSSSYVWFQQVQDDVHNTMMTFPGLRPKLDTYVMDNGVSARLLCLEGTIPIIYKMMTYNIPILLWIPSRYPEESPTAFVTPTTTMVVKNTKHVDLSGRIYHPYLATWNGGQERKSISQFLRLITESFSVEPPVYSRPASGNSPSAQSYVTSNSTLYRPPTPSQTIQAQQQQPNIPPGSTSFPNQNGGPYPVQQHHGTLPRPPYGSYYTPSPSPQMPPYQQTSSPRPPPHHQPQTLQYTANTQPVSSPSTPPQRMHSSHSPSHTNSGSLQRPTVPVSTPPAPPVPSPAALAKAEEEQLALAQMKSDLYEQLTRQWRDVSKKMMDDIENQMQMTHQVNQSHARVNQMMNQLQHLEGQYQLNIDKVMSTNQEIERYIEAVSKEPELNIDDDLRGTSTVVNQLMDAVAEEHALEDAIYQLTKAFGSSSSLNIDHAQWIKMVRNLAREQFMKKALIKKIKSVLSVK